ncbi:tRNA dimethylallyltransferase [Synechococcus sp. A18-25c]|nr:tRNA dimethylallyltransferase [Synechococcus sp. A18-25c]
MTAVLLQAAIAELDPARAARWISDHRRRIKKALES